MTAPDSPRKLLDMAVQMSEGLAAAHAAGIIHRDLKPDNILMTREGRIKILDFGLAKRAPENPAPGNPAPTDATVTVVRALTDAGTTLGTIAYMSPEQARGEVNLTAQSDQFSLGLVLYELAAGKKAFQRGSAAETMVAVPQRTRRNWLAFALIAAALVAASVLATIFLTPKQHNAANDRYTPIETSLESPEDPSWSPDGKAFTYSAIFEGKRQVFVRYLNATLSTRLTNLSSDANALGWEPDGKRIFLAAANPARGQPPLALFSVSIAGGEPELMMPLDVRGFAGVVRAARVSPDGKVLLGLRRESDGAISLVISSPVGSPWKRYAPAPFETKQLSNRPSFDLSPDGKKIVYFLTNKGENQAWLLPFPPGSGTPKRILDGDVGSNITFSWFPDSRHIAANSSGVRAQRFLRLLDTEGAEGKPITGGMVNQASPAVSPDGLRMLFLESTSDYRIVAASLNDASLRTWVRSQLSTGMPKWAPKDERFVYDTSSHGEPEIWLRESDGTERPVLTQSAFAPGTGSRFMNPTFSPDGGRLAVRRIPPKGLNSIWITSVAGGSPVRLTNDDSHEGMGVWSPDGARIVYRRFKEGTYSVMIAKTNGQATPVELVRISSFQFQLTDWSPTGEWIVYSGAPGTWALISPDGKDKRDLGKIATQHMTFSKDGKTLYGIRAEGDHQYLFSLTIATGQMKTIGDVGSEFAPRSYLNPGVRFSVSPDGESILYPTFSSKTGLWMLEGFAQP